MSEPNDTPTRWGYWKDGEFRVLPKGPMLMGGMGPPPFYVTLPSGEVRYVVEEATLPLPIDLPEVERPPISSLS